MDKPVQHQAITLPEPMSSRGSYSSPGYYVIDQTGSPLSDRYDTQSEAFANLRGGAGVSYLDQPQGGHLNQPWPPELHTVVGHETGQGGQMYSEADLLRAMASTNNLEEQRYLMSALEEVRRDARAVMAGANQVDFNAPNHVGEERPYHPYHSGAFGSSSATDWLGQMGQSNDGMQEHMLTMGSRFFIGCHPEVKADPVEYMTQALGVARVAAGQFADVEGAVNIFMDHVANLARVDLSKIAQEELLPWEAPPEQLPPVSTDEYSGPYSANQNTEVNDEPSDDGRGLPGLDNGQSGRPMMGGLSTLSSHPHMSEFLFEPPTPEELAQASGPANLNQNPNISGNQDETPEPNDDGALSGSMEGTGPVVAARHQAADDDDDDGGYKYIDSDNNIHKHVEGKGPLEGPIISHHDTKQKAIDSFKAMMRSKHGGSLQTGSRAQAPQQMTYEEYLARLSPGGYPVAREFFSGAMAAHAPSENDPTVPGWGKRQGPKASVTERPAPFRGVTTRISAQVPRKPKAREYVPAGGMDEGQMRQHLQDHHGIGVVSDWENYGEGVSDPHGEHELDHQESGEIIHHYHPDISRSGRKIVAEFDTGHIQRFVDWAQSQGHDPDELSTLSKYEKEPGIGRATANGIADQYHMEDPDWRQKERWNRTAANEDMLNPQAFERADESDAPALRPQPNGSYDPETAHDQSGEAAHEITGLVPQGDQAEPWSNISDFPETSVGGREAANQAALHQAIKWSPASGRATLYGSDPYGEFSPTHTYNPIGWDAFDARPHPGSSTIMPGSPIQLHGKMDPSGHLVHVRDENENHQTIDKRSLGTLRREAAAKPEDYGPEGSHGGATSSNSFINWDFNNTGSDLGMPPVEGYMRDADNPNGEMWPYEMAPLEAGTPPRGAADVANVPTPGAAVGYPQPSVGKSATLDAWRANIAARMGAMPPFESAARPVEGYSPEELEDIRQRYSDVHPGVMTPRDLAFHMEIYHGGVRKQPSAPGGPEANRQQHDADHAREMFDGVLPKRVEDHIHRPYASPQDVEKFTKETERGLSPTFGARR